MDSKSGSGSSGTFIWGVIAGIVALIGAGGLYLTGMIGGGQEQTEPSQTEVAAVQPADGSPEGESADEPETTAEPAAEPDAGQVNEAAQEQGGETTEAVKPEADTDAEAETAAPAVPVLDQIFVEKDGNAVLSGNADPGSQVRVLLDGEPVHSFTVDESGQFAEFVSIPFADDARGLVLETEGTDAPVRSDDYLIAALPAPEPTDEEPSVAETTEGETTETAEAQPTGDEVDQTAEAPIEESDENAQDQQVAVLRSGEEGVELVQPPASSGTAPDQVVLDTIGYSDAGEVELTGRAQDGSAVRLYLDNKLVADLSPAEDGKWRGEIEGVDPGVYTLRVDEVASDGTVVSRLETPFKREPQEVLRIAEATEEPEAQSETPPIRSVTVQKGDTLWAISRERFGDGVLYVKLFEANRDAIRDPDLIYPGQIFTIPE